MNINLSAFPATIDILHLGLAILALLFFILFLVKPKSSSNEVSSENTDVTADAAVESSAEQAVKEPAKTVQLKESTSDAALQLLTLLQQDARFIDFVQEDLTGYSDADIGAVARVVHEGSKQTLNSYFTFEAIRSEDEESRITLAEGFNASEVRLTGNVVGDAPFTGTLVHKGWKVTDVKLPKLAEGHDTSIVAAAEVEL
jgi:ABC-type anion transport system duplicated permease subunit